MEGNLKVKLWWSDHTFPQSLAESCEAVKAGRQAGRVRNQSLVTEQSGVIMGDILPVNQSTMQLVDTAGHCWSQTFNDNL